MNLESPVRLEEPSIAYLARRLWTRAWLIAICAALGGVVALSYLQSSKPTYTTELKITPANNGISSGGGDSLSRLGGIAAMIGASTGPSSATPFDLYLEVLRTRSLADELAKDQRVMRTVFSREWTAAGWREPPRSYAASLKGVLGLPRQRWRAPDGARLEDYLRERVDIHEDADDPVTILRYEHADPQFAEHLLKEMNRIADSMVRRRLLSQAINYSSYLSMRLRTVAVAEHRQALAEMLSGQEKLVMMGQAGLPYAASPIEAPTSSTAPTRPKPLLVLAAGILAGVALGVLAALIQFRKLVQSMRSARALPARRRLGAD